MRGKGIKIRWEEKMTDERKRDKRDKRMKRKRKEVYKKKGDPSF